MGTTILYLNYDVLQTILLLVVASAGGGKNLAKAMAVDFAKFGDDEYLVKMSNFDNFSLPESVEHCQHLRSLLIRCSEAGNVSAQYKLAQVILMWSTEHDRITPVPRFISYFTPEEIMSSSSTRTRFTHFELVSSFLRRFSIFDFVSMLPHVINYLNHFGYDNRGSSNFYSYFARKCKLLLIITDVGEYRGHTEPELRNARFLISFIKTAFSNHFMRVTITPTVSQFEVLKRECRIFSGRYAKPLEKKLQVLEMGKWFYNYLAFHGNVTRNISLPLDSYGSILHSTSILLAEKYYEWQQKAALAFDEMFLLKIRV